MDEIFQGLASIQTGKLDVRPFILMDTADGKFWKAFDDWAKNYMAGEKYINPEDVSLYELCTNVDDALNKIANFYSNLYSYFVLDNRIYFQLKIRLLDDELWNLSNYSQELGFTPTLFIRERYQNNTTLYVYSCRLQDRYNSINILKLIQRINSFSQ